MEVFWSEFKEMVDARSLSIQYVSYNGNYHLKAIDGAFVLDCVLPLDSGNADTLDFETNYLPTANVPIEVQPKRVMQTVGTGGVFSMRPRGFAGVAVKNTSTNIDFLVTENIRFIGGTFFSNDSVMGDELDLQIVDVDNILGYGANTVLKQYVTNWQVFPNVLNEVRDVDLSDPLPAGLYIRLVYRSHASATIDAHIALNLLSYVEE